MVMMRAIIGGAIGSAVATTVWLGLEDNLNRSFPWMVLAVGLCAGWGVRMACKADQRSIATGAIALLMALIGMVGGNFANVALLRYNIDTTPIATAPTTEADAEDADEELTADDADLGTAQEQVDDMESAVDDPIAVGTDDRAYNAGADRVATDSGPPAVATELPRIAEQPGEFSNLELAFYGIGCLFAYLLGAGGGSKPDRMVSTQSPTPPQAEPPAEG